MIRRLSTTAREQLYNAEAEKAREQGRGDLPICNICGTPIDGVRQRWDVSHDPTKPRWMGGDITGIAHARCNKQHAADHDTPKFAKNNRLRQRNIGARVSSHRPLIGTLASGIKLPLRERARPILRRTGE